MTDVAQPSPPSTTSTSQLGERRLSTMDETLQYEPTPSDTLMRPKEV